MAAPIHHLDKNDAVIELGGGTGVITKALLDTDINPELLYVVEKEKKLATILHKKFPNLKIITGDAVNIQQLIDLTDQKVGAFISGLLCALCRMMSLKNYANDARHFT